ncbi:MAG: putative sugar O-methyltransferase [Sulfuritalea sp.]|nr:putative sugar O-methyltransferase [Sulfuritalea sp.]
MPTKTSITLKPEQADRLKQFIDSKFFNYGSVDVAKSSYWQYHSSQLVTEIDSPGSVRVSGESGFYVPPPSSFIKRSLLKLVKAFQHPSLIGTALRGNFQTRFGTHRLMSYRDAFDAVMNHDAISDSDLSPWRVNHLNLARKPNVFPSSASIEKRYQSWSSYAASPSIINHYYYQNLMRSFISGTELRTVLEIGAGNGNFSSIIFHEWSPVRLILVDLPETICLAFSFLSNLFPEARIVLPTELEQGLPEQFDFALLTVDQLDLVESDSVDLAINCHSFQEMTQAQIAIYFVFIQRICRNLGYFFTANRIDKIPCGPDSLTQEQLEPPNRFAEYPWDVHNKVLIYEISRLLRLVQLDDVAIRLEQIHK